MNNQAKLTEEVLQWIELSQSDLFSSIVLYENRQHHASYFYFQQAVEKANKAFGLFTGEISEKEFKDIKHDQIKIYRKLSDKQANKTKGLVDVLEFFPHAKNHPLLSQFNFHEYHQSLNTGLSYIDRLRNLDLVHIPTSDINYLLDELYFIEEEKIKFPKKADPAFKEHLLNVIDWIGTFDTPQAKEYKREMEVIFKDDNNIDSLYEYQKLMFKNINAYASIVPTFVVCAVFTIQHSSLTRYFDGDKNPLKIYNKKLPLVRKQEEKMEVFETALRKFKRLVKSTATPEKK